MYVKMGRLPFFFLGSTACTLLLDTLFVKPLPSPSSSTTTAAAAGSSRPKRSRIDRRTAAV